MVVGYFQKFPEMYESFKILRAMQCMSDSMLTKSHGNSGHQINSNLMWIKRRTPNVWRSSVIKFQCFWIRQCAINLKMFFLSLRLGSTKTKIKTLECLKQSNFAFSYRSKWNSHKENYYRTKPNFLIPNSWWQVC